jgi:HK97 family phage major capsid protein
MQAVTRAEQMRAMAVGTGSAGGFAVPLMLDPTVMNTSSGAISPLRELATVKTISTSEWRGVSAAGVTSKYDAEAAEVNDDSPTLAQPAIVPKRWDSFVPFSIEVGMDWTGMQGELAELMRDSKDTLDATKFLVGTGVSEPGGILNIGGTGGLTTTQRVQTTTTAVTAIGDIYALKNALPPRFQPNASYLAAGATIDVVYRFVAAGSTTEPALVNAERTAILGKPLREMSTMSTATTTTASRILIYADFKAAFAIVERLGVQVELVNHLFGTNRRPTGQRGLVAFGRTGSGVINANAARYLEVK